MQARQVETGRTFVVVFEHGDDFFPTLEAFCEAERVSGGYIPMFVAGFQTVELVGTCRRLEDPAAPVWDAVQLSNVEAVGGGTLARDPDSGVLMPHLHVACGLKEHSAVGHTSHLLGARVQFLVEMVVVEVAAPGLVRRRDPGLYDVPLLGFQP
jgi:predicted DNA-binding protein with PD1-like motif